MTSDLLILVPYIRNVMSSLCVLCATLETPCKVCVTFSFRATSLTCTCRKPCCSVFHFFVCYFLPISFFLFFQKFLSCFLVWVNTLHVLIFLCTIISDLKSLHWNFHCFKEIRSTFLISKKSNTTIIGVWRDQYQDLLVCKKWYWPPLCIGQYHLSHTNKSWYWSL